MSDLNTTLALDELVLGNNLGALVVDANILIELAIAGQLNLLLQVPNRAVIITQEVYNETVLAQPDLANSIAIDAFITENLGQGEGTITIYNSVIDGIPNYTGTGAGEDSIFRFVGNFGTAAGGEFFDLMVLGRNPRDGMGSGDSVIGATFTVQDSADFMASLVVNGLLSPHDFVSAINELSDAQPSVVKYEDLSVSEEIRIPIYENDQGLIYTGRFGIGNDSDDQVGYYEIGEPTTRIVVFGEGQVVVNSTTLVEIVQVEGIEITVRVGRLKLEVYDGDTYHVIPEVEDNCFPAGTMVMLADGNQKPIETITQSDVVLTYDASGNAVAGIVDKLFTNTISEFYRLTFTDGRDDLIATAGHRFLTETGDYLEIGHMLRLGGGATRVVDVDGSIVEATGELIAYSAKTAHMFDQAQTKTIAFEGNTVFKEQVEAGWQTYNFEVREHHNYVAGGIRVHNDSILSTLDEGDVLVSLSNNLDDAAVLRDVDSDAVDELVFLDGDHIGDFLVGYREIVTKAPAGVTDVAGYLPEGNPNLTYDGMEDVNGDTVQNPNINGGVAYEIDIYGNPLDPGLNNVHGDGEKADDLWELVIDDMGFTDENIGEYHLSLNGLVDITTMTYVVEPDGNLTFSFNTFDGTAHTETVNNAVGYVGVIAATGAIIALADIPTTPEPSDNNAPVSVADEALTVEEDGSSTSVNVLANDTDAEDDALSITGTPTATNGTVVSNGDGTLTYTPNAGFVGSDVVTYQITDGTDTTTATLDVTVEAGNEAPVSIADPELVLDQGQSATTVDVLANDTDAEGEAISVTGTPSAANGTVVDNGDGTLTYTPNDGFFGTDVISYEITDGTNTTAASLDVTVNERDYIVKGTAGNDVLDRSYIDVDSDVVTDGDDTIEGLGGDDILEGGAGADSLDGGDGIDTASYANAAAGVVASLADAAGNTGDAAGDAYISIENLTGSAFMDTLTGDGANNLLEGGAGDDVLNGAAGADTLTGSDGADSLDGGADADNLSGGAGADTLLGGAGDDILSGGADDDLLIGGAGADLLDGGAGVDGTIYGDATAGVTVDLADASLNTGDAAGDTYVNLENVIGSSFADVLSGDSAANVLDGAAGNDTLSGRDGDDTLLGGAGDDLLQGGAGADVMDGGDDIDRVTYAIAAAAVMVDLSGTTANAGEATGDVITNVENLTGSAFGDTLTGSDDANEIDGGAGNDIINGGAGNDTIDGGDGDDIVDAGAGDDFVIAGPGADVLDGGDGFDVLSFQNADAPIEINLKNNKLDGPAAAVTFTNFEGFAGTEFADTMVAGKDDAVFYGLGGDDELTGHHGDDLLDGGTGNDDISGGKGEDTIIGGAGDDVLKGGTGDDVFIFNTGDGNDLISDFDKGKKSQDILQIDVAGFDSFADIEAAMTKDKGNTVIDLGNDQSITLQGVQPWQLTEDDFLFV